MSEKSSKSAYVEQGEQCWLLGNRHPAADKSIEWHDPFPNLDDSDLLIVDLTTLTKDVIYEIGDAKLGQAQYSIEDKILAGGTVVVITCPKFMAPPRDPSTHRPIIPHNVAPGDTDAYSNYRILPVVLETMEVPTGHRIIVDDGHDFKAYLDGNTQFDFYVAFYHPRISLVREGRSIPFDRIAGQNVRDNSGHDLGFTLAVARHGDHRRRPWAKNAGRLVFLPPYAGPADAPIQKILYGCGKADGYSAPGAVPARAGRPRLGQAGEREWQAAKPNNGQGEKEDRTDGVGAETGLIQAAAGPYAATEDTFKMFDQTAKNKVWIISEGNNVDYIKKAISIFAKDHESQIHVIDTIRDISDKNQLKTLFDFFVRVDHDMSVFVVWDPDCAKYRGLSAARNTYPIVLARSPRNTVCRSAGIESLFGDDYFDESETIKIMKGSRTMCRSFDSKKKQEFKSRILANANAESFGMFKDLVEQIVSVAAAKSGEDAARKTARHDMPEAYPLGDDPPSPARRARPRPSGRAGAAGAAGSSVSGGGIDTFLSYSHEVKDSVARPLVAGLQKRGVTVWWDNAAMRISDTLDQKIMEGIGRARHGVVIVSRGYLDSDWGKTELGAMFGRRLQIFPILYGVSVEDAQKKLPAIAGKIMRAWGDSPESIMDEIASAVEDGRRGRTGQISAAASTPQDPPLSPLGVDGTMNYRLATLWYRLFSDAGVVPKLPRPPTWTSLGRLGPAAAQLLFERSILSEQSDRFAQNEHFTRLHSPVPNDEEKPVVLFTACPHILAANADVTSNEFVEWARSITSIEVDDQQVRVQEVDYGVDVKTLIFAKIQAKKHSNRRAFLYRELQSSGLIEYGTSHLFFNMNRRHRPEMDLCHMIGDFWTFLAHVRLFYKKIGLESPFTILLSIGNSHKAALRNDGTEALGRPASALPRADSVREEPTTHRINIQFSHTFESVDEMTDEGIALTARKAAKHICNAYGETAPNCYSKDGAFSWALWKRASRPATGGGRS